MSYTRDIEFPFELSSECGVIVEAALVVNFTYQPAERGSRECGIQMEPDYEACVEVNAAKVVLDGITRHEFKDLRQFEPQVLEWIEAQRAEV